MKFNFENLPQGCLLWVCGDVGIYYRIRVLKGRRKVVGFVEGKGCN